MFELEILIANVVVPCVAMAIAAGATWWILRPSVGEEAANSEAHAAVEQKQSAANQTLAARLLTAIVGATGATIAVFCAFGLRNEFTFWDSQESWIQIPVSAGLVGLATILSAPLPAPPKWILRCVVLLFSSWLVFPVGESWDFLLEERPAWLGMVVVSALVPWLALEFLSTRRAGLLCFLWIGSCIAGAFLNAQSFMRVTEPMMAVASAFGVVGVSAYWLRSRIFSTASGVSLFAFSSCLANGQFNSYLGLTNWLVFLAMGSPALLAILASIFQLLDGGSATKLQDRPSTKYIIAAVLCAIALTAAVIIWTQMLAGGGEEDW